MQSPGDEAGFVCWDQREASVPAGRDLEEVKDRVS